MLDPPDTADAPPLTNLIALAARMGHRRRQQRRRRPEQHRAGGRPRPGRAGGRHLSGPPDHRSLPLHDAVPAGALGDAGHERPAATRSRSLQTSAQSWAESDVKALPERRPVSLDGDATSAARSRSAPPSRCRRPTRRRMTPPKPGQPPADEPKRPETRDRRHRRFRLRRQRRRSAFEGNSNLFVNTLNWLSEQENLIAIRPKAPDDRRVTMTEDQMRLVGWLSLIFVPGAVFAIGVYTWWRRRG